MLAPTPRDVASPLCDSSWPSCTRATAVPKGVQPNDETSVTVAIHAPANEGTLKACFGLLTGTHWFSDPGQNGPADDVLCKTIKVVKAPASTTTTPGSGSTPGGGGEAALDGDSDMEGSCTFQLSRRTTGVPAVMLGLSVLLVRRRRRRPSV